MSLHEVLGLSGKIAIEYVATADIGKGSEVYVDYGAGWHKSWRDFVQIRARGRSTSGARWPLQRACTPGAGSIAGSVRCDVMGTMGVNLVVLDNNDGACRDGAVSDQVCILKLHDFRFAWLLQCTTP